MNRERWIRTLIALAGVASVAHANAQQPLTAGQPFPDFKAVNLTTGKSFTLSSLRGKVVLVDFWATWCGPCVRELPNVKEAYQRYHEKGFEIVSISLDNDINRCKQFVEQSGMSWYNVCEGGGWRTRLATAHGIRSIPAMYVIDAAGVISSAGPRGPALERAIVDALAKIPGTQVDTEAPRKIEYRTRKTSGLGRVASPAERLETARKHVEAEKYVAAVRGYELIIKHYPNTDASKQATKELNVLRQKKEVVAALERDVARREKQKIDRDTKALLAMARALVEKKDYDSARTYYKRVIEGYAGSDAAKTARKELDAVPD